MNTLEIFYVLCLYTTGKQTQLTSCQLVRERERERESALSANLIRDRSISSNR